MFQNNYTWTLIMRNYFTLRPKQLTNSYATFERIVSVANIEIQLRAFTYRCMKVIKHNFSSNDSLSVFLNVVFLYICCIL